jgi:hypothetical protein
MDTLHVAHQVVDSAERLVALGALSFGHVHLHVLIKVMPIVECFAAGVARRVAQVHVCVRPASAVVAERLSAHTANKFVVFLYDVNFLGSI